MLVVDCDYNSSHKRRITEVSESPQIIPMIQDRNSTALCKENVFSNDSHPVTDKYVEQF